LPKLPISARWHWGCAQVFRLTRERRIGAKTEIEVVFGITSLARQQAGPRRLLELSRAHWGIENGLHGVRDGTLKEDASRVRKGSAAEVMGALSNIVIFLFDRLGHRSAASATGHYVCHPEKSLKVLAFPYSNETALGADPRAIDVADAVLVLF
jgi:predicted transposase YbfD/YdcC